MSSFSVTVGKGSVFSYERMLIRQSATLNLHS